jgi:hypothetical protein
MKKINGLLIILVFISFLLINIEVVRAAKGFVVEKSGSDKILITDGYSEYVIEHDYNCYSSDFYEGATIYIDTSYSPSYGDKIIISGYSDTICEITSSEDVNIKRYYVDDVFDSEDKIIVSDKNSDKFLVEYGIGCGLSMWRYEGKTIDIDIGGSFLDGIGDRIYLFDSGKDCKVWDADELSSSGISAPIYPPPSYSPIAISSCPTNSYSNGDKCTCVSGYVVNSIKTECVLAPTPAPLICDAGFIIRNGQCISFTQDCINNFGPNVIGSVGLNSNSSCNCASDYQWNIEGTACVVKIEPVFPAGCTSTIGYSPTTGMSCDGTSKCSDGRQLNGDKTACFSVPILPKLLNGNVNATTKTLKVESKPIITPAKKEKKTSNVIKIEQEEKITPSANPEPEKKVKWYQKIFNWFW